MRTPEGRAASRVALGLPPDRQTVACVGGSLGARRVNGAVADLAAAWARCGDRSLYHVTGRRDYDAFAPRRCAGDGGGGDGRGLCYRVVPFEDHMPDFYNAADVCVVRAGAMTVAELLIAGVPAILVPLPGAPRDHQTRNAEALVGMGAAVHVPDPECDGRRLALELDALLADPERLAPCARRPGRTATPTRPPASPNWSTPMPADGAATARPRRRPGASTSSASAAPA